ncbi:hypothetical protein PQX77_010071 [Marasmius sp. AFHP31]|nr:hypothetical protein PQX77_010071 [Marasmius sp. AFHP31]
MALARSGDEGAPFAFLVVENNSHNHKEDYIKGIFHSHLRMWQVYELADGQEREDIVENLTLACIWLPMDESALSKWLEVQPGTKKAQTDPTDWANYHSLASVFHFTRVEGEQRPELVRIDKTLRALEGKGMLVHLICEVLRKSRSVLSVDLQRRFRSSASLAVHESMPAGPLADSLNDRDSNIEEPDDSCDSFRGTWRLMSTCDIPSACRQMVHQVKKNAQYGLAAAYLEIYIYDEVEPRALALMIPNERLAPIRDLQETSAVPKLYHVEEANDQFHIVIMEHPGNSIDMLYRQRSPRSRLTGDVPIAIARAFMQSVKLDFERNHFCVTLVSSEIYVTRDLERVNLCGVEVSAEDSREPTLGREAARILGGLRTRCPQKSRSLLEAAQQLLMEASSLETLGKAIEEVGAKLRETPSD